MSKSPEGSATGLSALLGDPTLLRTSIAVFVGFFVIASTAIYAFGTNSPFWYANAIGFAALVRHPPRQWPLLLAAAWAADTAATALFGTGPAPLLALCDTLEMTLAATIIHRTGGLPAPLFGGWQIARFVAVCVLAPVLPSALGAGLLWWTDSEPFIASWSTWYAAAALGLLLVAPFLLAWTDETVRTRELRRATWITAGGSAAAVLCLAALLFSGAAPALAFLAFPFMLLVTWHAGLLGATSAALVFAAVGTWATLRGAGPIVHMVLPSTSVPERVQTLQLYLTSLLFTALPLAALFSHLRAMAAARTDFLAAMSHEIRTPMTGVLGMVELLLQEDLSAKQRKYVETIRSSGAHLLSIINDILDFSRFQAGRVELESVDFSLPDLLEGLRSLTAPLAAERGLELSFRIPEHSPPILRGDPMRLKQVLLNLLGNAVKFTEHGSVTLTISPAAATAPDQSRYRFEVRDTGIGIPPDKQKQIFEAFTQADNSTARQYGGSGLGLAISQQLVHAMGGDIELTSATGLGSNFSFEIPLSPGTVEALPARRETPAFSGLIPLRILVAEDVEVNRDILRHSLEKQGHSVTFALNGQQAVDQMQSAEYDLVLMDIQMPLMDGVEATRQIRKMQGRPSATPIIGLTANVMAHERERYMRAGMNACLMKPIDWEEFWKAIAAYAPSNTEPGHSTASEHRRAAAIPEATWVDVDTLDRLKHLASEQHVTTWVRAAMKAAETCLTNLQAAPAGERFAHAHALKGSAGTFGLVRVGELAGAIESAAVTGGEVEELIEQLADAVIRTKTELVRLAFLD